MNFAPGQLITVWRTRINKWTFYKYEIWDRHNRKTWKTINFSNDCKPLLRKFSEITKIKVLTAWESHYPNPKNAFEPVIITFIQAFEIVEESVKKCPVIEEKPEIEFFDRNFLPF